MDKKTKGYIAWGFVLITALGAQALVFGIRLNKKDRQVQALYQSQLTTIKVNMVLVQQIQVLTAKVGALEKKVQRLDMRASWYGPGFHGRLTASGTVYDQTALTCAHRTLPFGTVLVVEYKGKRVPCVVTDRGPYVRGRDLDLSLGVAEALGMVNRGVDQVTVYKLEV